MRTVEAVRSHLGGVRMERRARGDMMWSGPRGGKWLLMAVIGLRRELLDFVGRSGAYGLTMVDLEFYSSAPKPAFRSPGFSNETKPISLCLSLARTLPF
jgi:hypothetical protein